MIPTNKGGGSRVVEEEGRKDVRVSELWPREMFLGLGLRDGGRWIDACIACVEGVSPHGDSWVEGFGVEVFKVNGIIRPRHRVWHDRSTRRSRCPVERCLDHTEKALVMGRGMRTGLRLIICSLDGELTRVPVLSRAGRRATVLRETVLVRTNVDDKKQEAQKGTGR